MLFIVTPECNKVFKLRWTDTDTENMKIYTWEMVSVTTVKSTSAREVTTLQLSVRNTNVPSYWPSIQVSWLNHCIKIYLKLVYRTSGSHTKDKVDKSATCFDKKMTWRLFFLASVLNQPTVFSYLSMYKWVFPCILAL